MKLSLLLLIFELITIASSISTNQIKKYFDNLNSQLSKYNAKAAELTWTSIVGREGMSENATVLSQHWTNWREKSCRTLELISEELNTVEKRQQYLLCRQPLLTGSEARQYEILYNDLQTQYFDTKICIPTNNLTSTNPTLEEKENIIREYVNRLGKDTDFDETKDTVTLAVKKAKESKSGLCLVDEKEFNNLKRFTRNAAVAKFVWVAWRENFGAIKENYKKMVDIKNGAAKRVGFTDLGAAWRDELEIPNLRQYCRELYRQVKPVYTLIHGVVRYYLKKFYGDTVDAFGPMPAHLLGVLWSQDWSSVSRLIIPEKVSLDDGISNLKWNITHMAKRAEDFYQSLGLLAMTEKFWRHSVFDADGINCHGSAADMFKPGDSRAIICPDSPPTASDFYVLHHEFGHIQYYMAYEDQPAIFQQGANSAFHESIGDTIMLGVYTPQHLNRLGIVNDSLLYTTPANQFIWENLDIPIDMIILLQTALKTIPHIPFALLLDEFRWMVFEGTVKEEYWNEVFWAKTLELQGLIAPDERGEEYFDAAARYHVPDDTPYIRYFLTYFIQFQLFEELCRVSVYGHRSIKEDIPDSIPLHRCDIYGSKAVGKLLKDFMSRGSSEKWQETLFKTTGKSEILADSLLKYFKPLQEVLEKVVRKNNIPLGW